MLCGINGEVMDEQERLDYMEDEYLEESRSDVNAMIDRIRDYLSLEARKVPFSNKMVMVDKEHISILLMHIKDSLPQELRQAQHVVRNNKKIINEAESIAKRIEREAELKMAQMVDESEITQRAHEQAEEILRNAERLSEDLHRRSMAYLKDNIVRLEELVTEILVELQRNLKQLD